MGQGVDKMKGQYILIIHATDFVRGGKLPIGTDAEPVYIIANNFSHAELLAANVMEGDEREYDVFEIPKAAVRGGIDITPKPDALIFDAIDTPTEPGVYMHKSIPEPWQEPSRIEEVKVFLNRENLFVDDGIDPPASIRLFSGQWYKKRGGGNVVSNLHVPIQLRSIDRPTVEGNYLIKIGDNIYSTIVYKNKLGELVYMDAAGMETRFNADDCFSADCFYGPLEYGGNNE